MGVKDQVMDSSVVSTAMAVQKRYKADGADPFAAAIGFFAFLSLFPLLLLAISVAGFLLDDPADQVAVATAITEAIPGFEAAAEGGEGVTELIEGVVEQRGTIGLVGAVILLLSGLRVVNAAMIATRVVFRGAVQSGVMAKVRQVLALLGLGALALAGVAASSIAATGLGALPAPLAVVISLGITFVFDLVLFLGAYRLLSPTSAVPARSLVPGAILAAIGWTTLKVAGASYVGNQVESANALYGTLGGIIALMLLFYLAGRLYLYGAELTAVRHERVHGELQPPADDDEMASSRPASSGASTDARTGAPPSDGPPPVPAAARAGRPAAQGPGDRSPAIRERTRQQLAAADAARSSTAARTAGTDTGTDALGAETARADAAVAEGSDLRRTLALGLAVGALAAGWRYLGGSEPS
jgi:membrane protein